MKIFVGCSSSNNIDEKYKNDAKKLSEIISKDNDLVFGASDNGLMGIFYNEFLKNKRKIFAVCYEIYIEFLEKLKVDESYIVKTLGDSNEKLIELSDVLIFMPGGYGTMCELIYALETKRTKNHNKKIIIFNSNDYFDEQLSMYKNADNQKFVTTSYKDLCLVSNSVKEVIEYINN